MFLQGLFMSQFRLARICLILAAIGLNAAPALLPSAFAQAKPADAAAAAPKAETLRVEMYKLLDPIKVKELMAAKKFDEVQANVTTAEALPNLTPYETYIINRMKLALGSATGNDKMAMAALEYVINSGRMDKGDNADFIQALANYHYNAKDYAKALEWFKRYQKEAPDPEKVRRSMSRAHYLINDFATSKLDLEKLIADTEAAGKAPQLDDLRLLGSAAARLKDMVSYGATLEKMVKLYPSDELWTDLLRRVTSKPGFNNRLMIDVYRLETVALKELAADEYTDMAELALLAGFFTEAKQSMDAGFANGVLGKGANAAKHKQLRDKATKNAADDAKTIDAGDASARAAKTGQPMINLGYAYATMGQFDKGIELIEKGIAKGGLKNPEDAKLRLGEAQVKAGLKDNAIKTFESLKGSDGVADLGRYWVMFLKGPAVVPAAVPAAAK
jgi:tetratricopeptide (TPR) repeat protein